MKRRQFQRSPHKEYLRMVLISRIVHAIVSAFWAYAVAATEMRIALLLFDITGGSSRRNSRKS
jgi:hypothetical protein